MSKIVQWKRGNANVTSTYTGLEGEITINTDDWSLSIHDGTTAGGYTINSGNSSTGNLVIVDQTIQGTVSGANIVIEPNGGSIRANAQYFSVGIDAGLLISRPSTGVFANTAFITTANRGDGNISLQLTAGTIRSGITLEAATNNIGLNANTSNAGITVGSNIVTDGGTHNIGSQSRQWQNIWASNSVVINNNSLTVDSNGNLYIDGTRYYAGSEPNITITRNVTTDLTSIVTLNPSDLQITAQGDGVDSSIYLWSNLGKMSFNTLSNAFDYNFNGYISGTAYVASRNDPTGYSFYSPGDGYAGFSHVNGTVDYIRLTHNDVEAAKFYSNLTTQLQGNLVVSSTANVFGTFPNAFVQVYSNVSSYSQMIIQNLSADPFASSDIVLTGDDGNDSAHYLDIGMASSTYNYPGFSIINPDDAYIIVVGDDSTGPGSTENANLVLGSTNGNVKIFVGATEQANLVASFGVDGLIPGANVTYSLGSPTAQWKDLWVSNNTIYLGGFPITITANGTLEVNGSPVSSGNISSLTNGTSNIQIATANGSPTITSNSSTWTFGTDGRLTFPGTPRIDTTTDNFEVQAAENINFEANAAFNIYTDTSGGTYQWQFDTTGNLTVPGSIFVPSGASITGTGSPAPRMSGFSSVEAASFVSGSGNVTVRASYGNLRIGDVGNVGSSNAGITSSTVFSIVTDNVGTPHEWVFDANGTLTAPGNIAGNTSGFAIGYRDVPQITFTSNATLALTDAGKHYFSSNSANVITIPNNTSVSFNVGTAISIVQQGAASLTVTPGSGVTLYLAGNSTPSARTLSNYGMATLMKVGTDTWFINGTGVS